MPALRPKDVLLVRPELRGYPAKSTQMALITWLIGIFSGKLRSC